MITQVIWTDVNNRELDSVYARSGDEEIREIEFIICRNDPPEKVAIPAGVSGQFRIVKSSGNFVVRDMTKTVHEDGTVIFTVAISDQMVNVQGTGYYDIRLSGGGYLYTASGRFIVDTPVISTSVLEDVSEVNGLVFPDDFLTVEDHVAIIDDDTVSKDSTWSSDKISEEIEAHAGGDVSKTVSGNPVTFTDGASAPLVKCVTEIQGSQDLHGYDKPWVGGAGKNKLPLVLSDIKTLNTVGTWSGDAYTVNGVTFSIITDNYGNVTGIKVNGTATETIYFKLAKNLSFLGTFNGTYTATGSQNGGNDGTYALQVYSDVGGVYINVYGAIDYSVKSDSTPTANIDTVYITIRSGYTASNLMFYPMIRLSTVTDPTFAPYSNICPITAYTEGEIEVSDGGGNVTTHTTTYPSAIYQGSENVVNGEVVTDWGIIASYAGETLPGEWISDRDEYAPGTTPTTGAQVAYELATPTTSSVTPTNLPIKSLSGYNHIESSTGDMEVEYITERFQPLIDSIKQL